MSENGRYRIPRDNPFVSLAGARKEIWAYGLRNPHRLNWDVDPANPRNNHLIAAVIGWHTWETVVIIHKGANYGYPLREGIENDRGRQVAEQLPDVDTIPVQVTDVTTSGPSFRHIPSCSTVTARAAATQSPAVSSTVAPRSATSRQVRLRRHLNRTTVVHRLQGDARR